MNVGEGGWLLTDTAGYAASLYAATMAAASRLWVDGLDGTQWLIAVLLIDRRRLAVLFVGARYVLGLCCMTARGFALQVTKNVGRGVFSVFLLPSHRLISFRNLATTASAPAAVSNSTSRRSISYTLRPSAGTKLVFGMLRVESRASSLLKPRACGAIHKRKKHTLRLPQPWKSPPSAQTGVETPPATC